MKGYQVLSRVTGLEWDKVDAKVQRLADFAAEQMNRRDTPNGLRDQFAGQALQGTLAGHSSHYSLYGTVQIAEFAYQMADAMLAARGAK